MGAGTFLTFEGAANLLEKASRDMGYRSDSISISRDMGPLSVLEFRILVHRRKPNANREGPVRHLDVSRQKIVSPWAHS